MFVIGYIETVDKIARKDLSGEITQIQEWFREFHNRNGYFEAIVLGRMFGGDYLPICVEMKSGKMLQGNSGGWRYRVCLAGYTSITNENQV